MSVIRRTKLVKAGDWRTLESYWNVSGRTLFFNAPAGVQIRLRYSGWWTARAQAKSAHDVQLTYAEGAEGP